MDSPAKKGGAIGILWILILIASANTGIVFITACLLPSSNGFALFMAWFFNVVLILSAAVQTVKRLSNGSWIIVPIAGYILFSLIYGIMGGHIPKAFGMKETPTISVKAADRYPGYDVYHFSDGRVLRKYASGRRMATKRYAATYYHVAPVVADDWKEGDEFGVWVAWEGRSEFPPASWKQDLRGGYDASLEACYADLIRDRTEADKLPTRATAPILFWDAHPKESLMSQVWLELGILLGLDAVVFLALLIPGFVTPRA